MLTKHVMVMSLAVTFLSAATGLYASNAHAGLSQPTGQNAVLEKRITKAQCLKKPGYVWIEETKRCVKVSRGSSY